MDYLLNNTVSFNAQYFDGWGHPVDPDSPPTFAVYKDNVALGVPGSLSKIDDITGFFGGQVDLLTASGFEAGKNYTVRISAEIDAANIIKTVDFRIGHAPAAAELAAKVLINKTVQNKATGVITVFDDDGVTAVLTLTPEDDGENLTVTPG